jgi:hypothetical protein
MAIETLRTALACAAQTWTPHWGDTDAGGLVLTALYLLATALAWLVVARQGMAPGRERVFWGLTAVTVSLLMLNKQLDLQVLITATGRCLARLQGWYEDRRAFQLALTEALIAAALLIGIALVIWMRAVLWRNLLSLAGLGLLALFVILRVVSFHHVDQLLGTEILSLRANRLIEGLALILILLGSLAALRRRHDTA